MHRVKCTALQVPLTGPLAEEAQRRRAELVERVAEVDEEVGELFLMEEPVDAPTLQAAIRRATVALKFVPIFMGRSGLLSSARKRSLRV